MKKIILTILLWSILLAGCSSQLPENQEPTPLQNSITENIEKSTTGASEISTTEDPESPEISSNAVEADDAIDSPFEGYRLITVDGGDVSGVREANVVVDIGYGDWEYWAFTNEYGQIVKVIAKEIILQDDNIEAVTSDGRYYNDEASVPGTELADYDQGHIIADSLGGVSMHIISPRRIAF